MISKPRYLAIVNRGEWPDFGYALDSWNLQEVAHYQREFQGSIIGVHRTKEAALRRVASHLRQRAQNEPAAVRGRKGGIA